MAEVEHYREEQHYRQWWLWGLLIAVAAVTWWTFLAETAFDRSWTDDGWTWAPWAGVALGGVLLPLGVALAHMVTTVDDSDLTIGFWPLPARRIPLANIDSAVAVDHHPLRHFGGWGRRWHPTRGSAYSMSGGRGVQLVLIDGRRVIVGSQRAEELSATLRRRRHQVGRPSQPRIREP